MPGYYVYGYFKRLYIYLLEARVILFVSPFGCYFIFYNIVQLYIYCVCIFFFVLYIGTCSFLYIFAIREAFFNQVFHLVTWNGMWKDCWVLLTSKPFKWRKNLVKERKIIIFLYFWVYVVGICSVICDVYCI